MNRYNQRHTPRHASCCCCCCWSVMTCASGFDGAICSCCCVGRTVACPSSSRMDLNAFITLGALTLPRLSSKRNQTGSLFRRASRSCVFNPDHFFWCRCMMIFKNTAAISSMRSSPCTRSSSVGKTARSPPGTCSMRVTSPLPSRWDLPHATDYTGGRCSRVARSTRPPTRTVPALRSG